MKLLCFLLLLAGCADGSSGEPGTAQVRMNGVYRAYGGLVNTR